MIKRRIFTLLLLSIINLLFVLGDGLVTNSYILANKKQDALTMVEKLQKYHLRDIISVYGTYFDEKKVNRSHNIKLATKGLNEIVIMPAEVFSFNEAIGPRSKVAGYKEGPEIFNGEIVSGVGGGICQVSSTLYNTVLLANLEIIERVHHSRPVGYVPLGRGATVYYDYIDFKFKNNKGYPVMILASIFNNQLTISLLGRESGEQIEIITSPPKIIEPKVIKKIDKSLPIGTKKVIEDGKKGFEVLVKKVIKKGNKIMKEEIISKDIYNPVDRIIKINPAN